MVALVSINGVALPTPTEFQVGTFDISKAQRNANGNMIIERITTKKKLFLTYAYLSREDLKTILNLVAPTFYNVQYVDPDLNAMRTGSFYSGDRNVGMVDYVDGIARYKDLSFNLIER
jgi:hypothetical protein